MGFEKTPFSSIQQIRMSVSLPRFYLVYKVPLILLLMSLVVLVILETLQPQVTVSRLHCILTEGSCNNKRTTISRKLLNGSLCSNAYGDCEGPDEYKTRGNTTFAKHITERLFVSSEYSTVFIFGAVVRSIAKSKVKVCNIYGQWDRSRFAASLSIRCCFKITGNVVLESHATYYGETWHNKRWDVPMEPWFVSCVVPKKSMGKLELVSIVNGFNSCSNTSVNYIAPYHPKQHEPGYLVISTKTAHEKLDPQQVVAQFESFRYLGVDKVVTYIEDSLWEPALKVFHHYASIGFLEMYSYEVANMLEHPRKIAEQTSQIYADQVTVMRDAIERNSGATYFGILDNDEFPIPSNYLTLKEILSYMDLKHPEAASFTFKNRHYFTDIEERCSGNCTYFQRYLHSPPNKPSMYHRKMICHPSRVQTGTLNSHKAHALPGYIPYLFPLDAVHIRHYGSCKRKFRRKVCERRRHKWRVDKSMVSWSNSTIAKYIKQTLEQISVL